MTVDFPMRGVFVSLRPSSRPDQVGKDESVAPWGLPYLRLVFVRDDVESDTVCFLDRDGVDAFPFFPEV